MSDVHSSPDFRERRMVCSRRGVFAQRMFFAYRVGERHLLSVFWSVWEYF